MATMPAHWREARGKQLFVRAQREPEAGDSIVTCFRDGRVTLRSNRRTTGFTEADKEHGYQRILRGDLVIHAMDAFAGAAGVSDSDGKATPVYAALVARRDANPYFYAHVIRELARRGWIQAQARGVRERSTEYRHTAFANEDLPVPPTDEQAAIVKYLGHAHARIDRAIAAKRKLIALLEEQKQAIIHQAVTRGLDPTVPLMESGIPWLGQIPAHWELLAARHLFHAVNRPVTDAPLPQMSLTRAQGLVESGSAGTNTQSAVKSDNLQTCERGDFVLNKYRAHLGLFRWCRKPGLVTRNYTVLAPSARVVHDFFEFLFLDPIYAEGLKLHSRGVGDGMSPLYTSTLYGMRMPVPPLEEQRDIAAHITEATARARETQSHATREIELLREFRTRLTSDIVTGQVDVRQIAATLPELTDDMLASGSGDTVDTDLEDVDDFTEGEDD